MCGDGGDHLPGFLLCGAGLPARGDPDDFRVRTAPCAIIAAVKAWHAAIAAFVFLVPQASTAADDLAGAARELARKTSALSRGSVVATYRNLSSLPDSEITQVRKEFESALVSSSDSAAPAVEARLTLSESATHFLLVEEVHKSDESQVWIATWKRADHPGGSVSGVALDKRLIWEQDDPILDAAQAAGKIVVLSPSRITVGGQSVAITAAKPWPRDLRGHLRLNGDRIQVFLPGVQCSGSLQPSLSLECRPSDEPWVVESGSRAILLANFAAERNYFDGRIVTQNGLRKSLAPFYSAAAVEEPGGTAWLLAELDGRTEILDRALEPVGTIPSWGSDVAGTSARCGGGSQVLATRPGDASEADAIQAFALVNRTASPLTPPVLFAGPVTTLWTSSPTSVLAVSRDASTGKYAAYEITVVCTP